MMNTATLPDTTVTIEEMYEYGYDCHFMLPLKVDAAKSLWVNANALVYRLYPDGTEAMVESVEELSSHAENGGLFGIEKVDWEKVQKQMTEMR